MLETSSPRRRRRNCRRSWRRDIRPRRMTNLRQTCSNEFKKNRQQQQQLLSLHTLFDTPPQLLLAPHPSLLFDFSFDCSTPTFVCPFVFLVCLLPDFIGRFFHLPCVCFPVLHPPPALLCCRGLLLPRFGADHPSSPPTQGTCASAPFSSSVSPHAFSSPPPPPPPLRYQSATLSLCHLFILFFFLLVVFLPSRHLLSLPCSPLFFSLFSRLATAASLETALPSSFLHLQL